jgi:IS30 family transposase
LGNSLFGLHKITFDNAKGCAGYLDEANVLNIKTYFARPYTSQDKGPVENRIGQLRRFFLLKKLILILFRVIR